MIRKVIQANENFISLQLPGHFIGKEIEVIVFTIDEAEDNDAVSPSAPQTHLASEGILSEDWLNKMEDGAWKDL